MPEEIKSRNIFLKIGGQVLAIVQVLLVLLVFLAVQVGALLVMLALGLDYDVYTGSFTMVYAIILSIVMYGLLQVAKMEKGHKSLLMTEKIPPLNTPFIIIIALGMLGFVTVFMMVVGVIAEAGNAFWGKAVEDYSEAMDRYSNVESAVIPKFDHVFDFIGSVLIIPLAEELTFRGAIMGGLMKKFKPVAAIFLSALIFGLVHGLSIQVIYAFVCGLILGTVYYITRSIWGSYFIHMVFNLFGGGVISFMESSVINASESMIDNVNYYITVAELMCMIPAFVSLVFLYKIYEMRRKDEQT